MSIGLLLEITVKASIVLALALVATELMKTRSSAGLRHLVWMAAVGALSALPLLVAFGPSWRVVNRPDRWVTQRAAAAQADGRPAGRRADEDVWPIHAPTTSHAPAAAGRGAGIAVRPRVWAETARTFWPDDRSTLVIALWTA